MCYEQHYFLQVEQCILERYWLSEYTFHLALVVLAGILTSGYLTLWGYARYRALAAHGRPELVGVGFKPLPRTVRKLETILGLQGYNFLDAVVLKSHGIKFNRWIHVSSDHEIVLMTQNTTLHFFSYIMTLFEDGSLVITFFPVGMNTTSPTLHTSFARRSLENALTHHRTEIEGWKLQHAVPFKIETTDDFARLINIYFEQHNPIITPYFQREWYFATLSYGFATLIFAAVFFGFPTYISVFGIIALCGCFVGLVYHRKFWQAVDHRRLK